VTDHPVGVRVARQSALAFAGFAVPLALALIAIPVAARALGPVRFGLLGLAWAIVEYLGFFDFGLTRGTIRFVADARVRAPREIRQIVAISLSMQLAAGVIAGLLVWSLSSVLVTRVFSVPLSVQGEAAAMFEVVGANVAIMLVMSGLRGVLEGAQRFDLSTSLKIPGAAASVVIPAVGALAGLTLPSILWLVFLVRVLVLGVLVAIVPRAIDDFGWEAPREWRRLRSLLGYSGWLAVSAVANSLLINFDRFALATLAGVAAVGFYAAPYEGATKLLLIPVSIFAVLFPALTMSEARSERSATVRLMESALRQLVVVLIPAILVLVLFAPEILRLWLGPMYAREASWALRALAVGVFANALAHVPSVFLYAAGRPDLPAKLHLVEVMIHVPLTILFVSRLGITGAAFAWALRVLADGTVLMYLARRLGALDIRTVQRHLWFAVVGTACALGVAAAAARLVATRAPWLAAIILLIGAFAYATSAWRNGLAPEERTTWLRFLPGSPHSQARRRSRGAAIEPR
jgi:O-antigen/teichoic acid export membrane protein